MATPDRRNGGAVAGIRLTEINIEIRRRYGRILLERAIKEMEPIAAIDFAAELHRAVEAPSDKLYWVPVGAIERVIG